VSRGALWFCGGAALLLLALGGATWALRDLQQREHDALDTVQQERAVGEALLRMDLAMLPLLAGEDLRWSPEDELPKRATSSATAFLPERPHIDPFQRRYFAIHDDDRVTTSDGSALGSLAALLRRSAPPPIPVFPPSQQNVDATSFEGRTQFQQYFNSNIAPAATVAVGQLVPSFLPAASDDGDLFLLRRNDRLGIVQGVRMDWPSLEQWLLGQVVDLLPAAHLVPIRDEARPARRLASLPVALEPGPLPAHPASPTDPLRLALLIAAWLSVLGALTAVGFALRAANGLAARRAMFVSSVTHELRTPLTTFRMYAQMLADGMVPAAAQPEYLETLRGESERLCRIVESVLLYARLEDGRGGAHRVSLTAAALLDRAVPHLQHRCAETGRVLATETGGLADAAVHVDPQTIEQILLNLVDNACKYAANGAIRVRATAGDGALLVDVQDDGPGIAADDAPGLFRPFQRGRAHATGALPGLGLGLSIARGLARAMDGELTLHATGPAGTTFRLRLPLVAP